MTWRVSKNLRKYISVILKENIRKCFLVKKDNEYWNCIYKIKNDQSKILGISAHALPTKIFNFRATNWYIMSQNEASLHNNVSFELKSHFQR